MTEFNILGGNYQSHIYDIETKIIPENQMQILKYYLLTRGISKDEPEVKTTYELVYMAKKQSSSKSK